MPDTYRVAIIGSTGRGDYGHGIDTVWKEIPKAQVVALADENEAGRAAGLARTGAKTGYADFRSMLDQEKPDIVAVCPRWIDRHHEMVSACLERGCHVYMEKPFCRTLEEADSLVRLCEMTHAKLAIAHQTRYSPTLPVVKGLLDDGTLGTVLELRARGKEDHRGGAEDLWVLGSHVLNLLPALAGTPQSCFATLTQRGKPAVAADVIAGREGLGPLAGDAVDAMFTFKNADITSATAGNPGKSSSPQPVLSGPLKNGPADPKIPAESGGPIAYFASHRGQGGNPSRYGLQIFGSKGVVEILFGYLEPVHYLADAGWSPARSGANWVRVTSAGIGKPEPLAGGGLHAGNIAAVRDLLASIEENRQPLCSIYEARGTVEMIMAVFESHRVGKSVSFPLQNRKHPLSMLT